MFKFTYQPNYRIVCDYTAIPTYSVVYRKTNETLSHHETAFAARRAAQQYHAADQRRVRP